MTFRPDSGTARQTSATTGAAPRELVHRSGHWIDNWDPEDNEQWNTVGAGIARRNLNWSIFAEFLGFVIWQLWSIVVVSLPAAGFHFDTAQTFWLISIPSLVGATLRFPYSFMVPKFGGRNWTIVSASLLLIPSTLLGIAVSNPDTPFGVMLLVAALAGLGGGNFASSMSNITFFYPQRQKGWALGLNAAGGNLGAAVAQFLVPIAVTVGAATTLNLGLAGFIWIPLILVATFGAWRYMDNISSAKADFQASLAAIRERHLWILAILYVGTFGSFIGFASVFPKLIADEFPHFSTFQVAGASLSLAFLGALVGSLSRPFGGKFADRVGGARVTIAAFAVMTLGALAVMVSLPLHSFSVFLGCFLMLFVAAGVGNGATYRMIPTVFAARAGTANAHHTGGHISVQREAAAALGLISAIGAYGGFIIPQVLSLSKTVYGDYASAFYWFIAAYAVMIATTAFCYLRRGSSTSGQRI